jgi:uncharacterized protein YhbP (UPF0306 family)
LSTSGLRNRVQAYLAARHVMTLATASDQGPWAAALFYVHEGWTLYFLSASASRHCRNIARNPRVSATIQEDYADWRVIKGVQLEGSAILLSGADAEQARRLYGAKFPLVGNPAVAPAAIVAAMAKISWYRVAADRAYFIDNSVAFGHRDELDLS